LSTKYKKNLDPAWPIGMNPDGTLNVVNEDDPPFVPKIVPEEEAEKTRKAVSKQAKTAERQDAQE
jgi:hypothetical protein